MGGLDSFWLDVFNGLGLRILYFPMGLEPVSWLLLVSKFVFHGGVRWFRLDDVNRLVLYVLDRPVGLALVSWLLMVAQFVFHGGLAVVSV